MPKVERGQEEGSLPVVCQEMSKVDKALFLVAYKMSIVLKLALLSARGMPSWPWPL